MQRCVLVGIFLSLVAVLDMRLGDAPYLVLATTAMLVLLSLVVQRAAGDRIVLCWSADFAVVPRLDRWMTVGLAVLWIGVIGSWFYGALLGVALGNAPESVARNFFGLLLYALMPLLLLARVDTIALVRTIIAAGFVQCIVAIIFTALFPPDLVSLLEARSISDFRSVYSVGFIVMFPLLTAGLATRWLRFDSTGHAKLPRLVLVASKPPVIVVVVLALIVPAMSKGFILATGVLIFGMLILALLRPASRRFRVVCVVLLFATIGALLPRIPPEALDLIRISFSVDEGGNTIRAEQYRELVREIDAVGNGLGATLRSGYRRDDTGYGFELTYVNLLHKLGVSSIFLFASYGFTLLLAGARALRGHRAFESCFAIGCMGYLIVGSANPLLLSPVAVTLHCIAMYLLIRPSLDVKVELRSHAESTAREQR